VVSSPNRLALSKAHSFKKTLELVVSSDGDGDGNEVLSLLQGMQKFFEADDNCDENILFSYHKQTVASIYIGRGLGKLTVQSVMKALIERLQNNSSISSHTVAQLCGDERPPEKVFGISIDTTRNLVAVQRRALGWSRGDCAADEDLKSAGFLSGIQVFEIAGTTDSNVTNANSSLLNSRPFFRPRSLRTSNRISSLDKLAVCRYTKVIPSDSCGALVSRCGISISEFNKFNPKPTLCSTLMPGDYICCSPGDPYTEPKPDPPKQYSDGTCALHLIKNNDN
jgi:hypothetical protein